MTTKFYPLSCVLLALAILAEFVLPPAVHAQESTVGRPAPTQVFLPIIQSDSNSLALSPVHSSSVVTTTGVIATLAGSGPIGSGTGGYSGDGGSATAARLDLPTGVAVSPDGSVYIADFHNNHIRRVGLDGMITLVIGDSLNRDVAKGCYTGRPYSGYIPPTLHMPYSLAFSPDGSLYISESDGARIRRLSPDGSLTTIAGLYDPIYCYPGYSGDGGLATAAKLNQPRGLAVAPDGSLYIADYGNHRVRRVGPDGLITTVAGTGIAGYSGDGGLATAAQLKNPEAIAVSADGTLYIAERYNYRVRRVSPDGIITTFAGIGLSGYSGDGGPATGAKLQNPAGLALGADGALYIADINGERIRRVDPNGIITTVAGTGYAGYTGDGGLAVQGRIWNPLGIAVGADDRLYIADNYNNRIRVVASPSVSLIR